MTRHSGAPSSASIAGPTSTRMRRSSVCFAPHALSRHPRARSDRTASTPCWLWRTAPGCGWVRSSVAAPRSSARGGVSRDPREQVLQVPAPAAQAVRRERAQALPHRARHGWPVSGCRRAALLSWPWWLFLHGRGAVAAAGDPSRGSQARTGTARASRPRSPPHICRPPDARVVSPGDQPREQAAVPLDLPRSPRHPLDPRLFDHHSGAARPGERTLPRPRRVGARRPARRKPWPRRCPRCPAC